MNRFAPVALAVGLMAAPAALAGSHEGTITNWEKDPEAGLARARAIGLPTMLFFTADW